MYDKLAHIVEELADFLIGAEVSVCWMTLDSRQHFSVCDYRAVIKDLAEQSQVVHL